MTDLRALTDQAVERFKSTGRRGCSDPVPLVLTDSPPAGQADGRDDLAAVLGCAVAPGFRLPGFPQVVLAGSEEIDAADVDARSVFVASTKDSLEGIDLEGSGVGTLQDDLAGSAPEIQGRAARALANSVSDQAARLMAQHALRWRPWQLRVPADLTCSLADVVPWKRVRSLIDLHHNELGTTDTDVAWMMHSGTHQALLSAGAVAHQSLIGAVRLGGVRIGYNHHLPNLKDGLPAPLLLGPWANGYRVALDPLVHLSAVAWASTDPGVSVTAVHFEMKMRVVADATASRKPEPTGADDAPDEPQAERYPTPSPSEPLPEPTPDMRLDHPVTSRAV